MTNPFEDDDADYVVLINDEGQYSLWPHGLEIPAGWTSVHTKATRQECLNWVDEHWTDMRPNSLLRAMSQRPIRNGN